MVRRQDGQTGSSHQRFAWRQRNRRRFALTQRPMKRLHRLLLLICLLLLAGAGLARGQETIDQYRSYTVDHAGRQLPIPDPYILDRIIDKLATEPDELSTPRDIYLSRQNGHLYIADTGNNRIIELDAEGEIVRILGEALALDRPQGIFRNPSDGTLWIADTGNARILNVSEAGEVLQEFGAPQSDVLVGISAAAPSKVLIDKRGYIYYLEGTGAGMIVMDQQSRFRGFFGSNRKAFSLRWLWARYLATEEQKEKILLSTPTAHSDMYLGHDGFVYTSVGGESARQVQKLSPVGVNIFVEKSLERKLYKNRIFGEKRRSWEPPHRFGAVTVDDVGTVTVLDQSSGRVYQYDQDRNLLMAFGRMGIGRVEFGLPSEIEVDRHGYLYVLDSARSVIYVLRPTQFAKLVQRASALQYDGRYEEAAATWRGVLDLASNYELAHSGMAAAFYHQERWQEAMREYALAHDQLGYALAFYEHRQDQLRQNMGFLVSAVFVLMAGVVVSPALSNQIRIPGRRRAEAMLVTGEPFAALPPGAAAVRGRGGRPRAFISVLARYISIAWGMLRRPVETMESVALGRSLWLAVGIVVLAAAARIVSLWLIAFHMRATPTVGSILDWVRLYRPVAAYLLPELRWEDSNLFFEAARIVVPWLLWTVSNYGVSALFDGEGTFRAVARTTACCLIPYIIFAIPIALLSHVMTVQERGFYEALWSLLYVWILILLVVQVRTIHNYPMGRTFGVGVLKVFGMMILAGALVLVALLSVELIGFLGEVGIEILRIVI